jgi:uncharacterized protein YcbK (DUF882 family)
MNYFTEKELACPCCGKNNIQKFFLDRLNRARNIAEIPFHTTSICRCIKHNESELVGGSKTSSHLKGLAADIYIKGNSTIRFIIISALLKAGFTRIGIGKTFIHVDSDFDKKQKVCWLY